MEKANMHSLDMVNENIKKIGSIFPECVTETVDENGNVKAAIDFEKLQENLSHATIGEGEERYQFTWPGKREAIHNANAPTNMTLRPCKAESVDFDNTENLYIEGDNLEVLKLLQENYLGKVKMIYIDPPYNTGNDFVYNDNFTVESSEFRVKSGMFDEDGNMLLQNFEKNTESNGRFHTDWLNMMYPRLKIARNLLSDDGVIFISIDDNEVENLKKICNEVFGESNFEGHIHWRRRHNQPNDKTKTIGIVTDHILVYAKDSSYLKSVGVGKLDLTATFTNPDNDPRGPWASKPWKVGSDQSGSRYTIVTPTGIVLDGEWMGEEKTYKQYLEEGRIYFPKGGDGMPRKKYYQFERENEGQCATNWWTHEQFGHNQGANDCMTKLFGAKNVFSNPKPLELLRAICKISNLKKDDIALDFFSGSATTAHAVMQLNAEERESLELRMESLDRNDPEYDSKLKVLKSQLSHQRKFIMVQLPELTDEKSEAYKAGYKNICEIGKERIRRAGDQILELSLQNLEKEGVIEKIEKSKLSALSSQHSKELSLQNLDGVDSVEYCREAISGDQGVYPVFENSKGITSGTGNTIVDLRTLEILNERGYRIKPEALGRNQQNDLFADKAFDIKGLSSKLSVLNSDRGFRVLKLASSNMKDVYYSPAETTSPDLFDPNNVKEDRTPLDLLFQVMPECNLPLSSKIEERTIEGKTVYFVNGNYLVACFDEGITEKLIKAVIDVPDSEKPYYFYMRNLGLESDKVLDNFEQLFVHYSPSTRRKVI